MRKEQIKIMDHLRDYLIEHPTIRFCQALHNLGINGFIVNSGEIDSVPTLKDPYNDSDEAVLKRIEKNLQVVTN